MGRQYVNLPLPLHYHDTIYERSTVIARVQSRFCFHYTCQIFFHNQLKCFCPNFNDYILSIFEKKNLWDTVDPHNPPPPPASAAHASHELKLWCVFRIRCRYLIHILQE